MVLLPGPISKLGSLSCMDKGFISTISKIPGKIGSKSLSCKRPNCENGIQQCVGSLCRMMDTNWINMRFSGVDFM